MNSVDAAREETRPAQSPGACVADRLLATASALFYREGIHAVGIQRVIEEAGIAKASLYAHYKSKDELVAAYLRQRSAQLQTMLADELARIADPVQRLLHLFERHITWVESGEFRGCPFQNAHSELSCATHPARAALADHQAWMHRLVTGLVHDAGITEAEPLTGALLALLTGAGARALAEQSAAAAHDARWAAAQLIAAARAPHEPPASPTRRRPVRSRM